jgi:hypothetical protein
MSKTIRLVWLLIALSGCGCSNHLVLDDIFQSDCDPPCWRGIVPGVTTREEVKEILGEQPEGEDPSFPVLRWGNRCVKGGGVSQVKILFDQANVVASVTLAETDPRYTFGDVVSEHGPPSSVMMNECSPDSMLGYIYLVYHQDGVAFATGYVPVLGEPWQRPSARERVYQWIYFAPTTADKMLLKEGIISGCGPVFSYNTDSSEWLGFGQ